jgi:hypothetical protein
MEATKPKQPRQGQRRTTLSLTPELWDQLQAIEKETGARPSVTVRRILQQSLSRRRKDQPPAA